MMSLSAENSIDSGCVRVCIFKLSSEQAQWTGRRTAVDEQLENLINEVCQPGFQTPERQKALNRLLIAIQQLPGIYKCPHQDYPQALNKTWEWVSRNICQFEPRHPSLEKSLIKWINGYLKWRIRDLYTPDPTKPVVISIDQPIINNDGNQTTLLDRLPDPHFTNLTLDLLDIKIAEIHRNERQRLGQWVRQQIIQDEYRKLRACHPGKYPQCHCQLLAQRLLLQHPQEKIADIAREFNIHNQTLHSHWKRKCLPLLQDIAKNCGYEL